jgi:sodium/potassium/calcium exchanger 6
LFKKTLKDFCTYRLLHNIAGVTILAFGNGAPDFFTALAAVNQRRTELILGGLFGAGIFVTTVVAGSVIIAKPFKLMKRPFLRDVTFYIAAIIWAICIFCR